MSVKIGINGFGRIGRNFFRAAKQRGFDFDFVGVNDLGDAATHGAPAEVRLGARPLSAATSRSAATASSSTATSCGSSPSAIRRTCPWKELGAEIVIESTGIFTDRDKAAAHLEAGAAEGHHQRARPRTRTSRSCSA